MKTCCLKHAEQSDVVIRILIKRASEGSIASARLLISNFEANWADLFTTPDNCAPPNSTNLNSANALDNDPILKGYKRLYKDRKIHRFGIMNYSDRKGYDWNAVVEWLSN